MPLTRLPTRTDCDRPICGNKIPHARSLFSSFLFRPARAASAGVTGILLLLAFVLLWPIPSMAQTTEQKVTVLHLSQTAERKVVDLWSAFLDHREQHGCELASRWLGYTA